MSFDKLAGIYVYCMDFHSGQSSRLYRIMCKLNASLPDSAIQAIRYGKFDRAGEWEAARMFYRHFKRLKIQ